MDPMAPVSLADVFVTQVGMVMFVPSRLVIQDAQHMECAPMEPVFAPMVNVGLCLCFLR